MSCSSSTTPIVPPSIAAPSGIASSCAPSTKTDEELAVEFIKAALNRREVRMKDEAIQAILRTLETNPLVARYKTGWAEQRAEISKNLPEHSSQSNMLGTFFCGDVVVKKFHGPSIEMMRILAERTELEKQQVVIEYKRALDEHFCMMSEVRAARERFVKALEATSHKISLRDVSAFLLI